MTKLYSDLAYLYDALYQTFIDYDAEFRLYKNCFEPYDAKSVLEIGCGSGHLAQRFLNAGYDYAGIDISPQMLDFARQRCPTARFEQADMRMLDLGETFDAVLITARSLSYILMKPVATDDATLRAFLPDEIRLLLHLAGLEVLTAQRQPTYAFDTWVFSVKNA